MPDTYLIMSSRVYIVYYGVTTFESLQGIFRQGNNTADFSQWKPKFPD